MPPKTEGYIKLWRQIKESPVYHAPAKCRLLWYEILLRSSYEQGDYDWLGPNKVELEKGQLLASQEEMGGWIEASKPTVSRYLELMNDEGMVETETENKGKYKQTLITVLNWGKYQGDENDNDEDETSSDGQDLTPSDGHEFNHEFNHDVTTCTKEVKECEECQEYYCEEIFDHWVEVEAGTKHRNLSEAIERHIKARFNDGYSVEYIKDAISNLAKAYKSDEYYWSHRWGLDEFLKRGEGTKMEKFHDGIEWALNDSEKGGDQDVKPGQSSANLQRVS